MPGLRHRLPEACRAPGISVAERGEFDWPAEGRFEDGDGVGCNAPLSVHHFDEHERQVAPWGAWFDTYLPVRAAAGELSGTACARCLWQ